MTARPGLLIRGMAHCQWFDMIALPVINGGNIGRTDNLPVATATLDPAVAGQIENARQTNWAFQPVKAGPAPTAIDAGQPRLPVDRRFGKRRPRNDRLTAGAEN